MDHSDMDHPEETAQIYDPETGRVTVIPIRELSDAMIALRLDGIEGTVYVDQSLVRFEKGPIRHETLPDGLEDRIRALDAIFSDVLPESSDAWLDDFRRDEHPEMEVLIWERIARCYLRGVGPSDSIERKRDVLKVLLSGANNSPQVAALTAACETLTHDEVLALCADLASED